MKPKEHPKEKAKGREQIHSWQLHQKAKGRELAEEDNQSRVMLESFCTPGFGTTAMMRK